ncbi:hypothetical protein BDC45DRAFT_524030 [Circinella umbellata]|nr:hypothetical protein BDC45DRAFT_524030 [Circinella umbellata]
MTTLTTTATATTTPSISKGKKPYKSWLKDGVNGGMSSMDILIHWLANKTNYSKWRGGDNNAERTPKKVLLEEIIERMRQVGIYHRLPKDVASKISTLQSNYRTTREWNDTEGKKLRQAGVKEEIIHEEIIKRFPYWDALHGSFGNFRTSPSWPMSISSIMDREEEKKEHQRLFHPQPLYHHRQRQRHQDQHHSTSPTKIHHHHLENLDTKKIISATTTTPLLAPPLTSASSSSTNTSSNSSSYFHPDDSEDESSVSIIPSVTTSIPAPGSNNTSPTFTTNNNSSNHATISGRRRRRMSDSHLLHSFHNVKQPRLFGESPTIAEATTDTIITSTPNNNNSNNNNNNTDVDDDNMNDDNNSHCDTTDKRSDDEELTESLLKVTREKEAGRIKRSQDRVEFLREKRMDREQLLIEQERTRRIRAKAELVKNLMEAGFSKQEIAEQLQFI